MNHLGKMSKGFISMRHLIGLLSVDTQFLRGVRNFIVMSVISNFGFAFEKTSLVFKKEKFPPKRGEPQNHY